MSAPSGVEVTEAVPSFSVELDGVTACTAGVSSLEINAAGLIFDAAVSRTAESVEGFFDVWLRDFRGRHRYAGCGDTWRRCCGSSGDWLKLCSQPNRSG